jgi:hypothetical protein
MFVLSMRCGVARAASRGIESSSLEVVGDAAFGEIVARHLDQHLVKN